MAESDPDVPHADLAGYLLDALTPGERRAFEAHLASCARCQHEAEQLRPLPGLLARAGEPVEVPAGLRARVLGAVAREPARGRPARIPVIRLGWRPGGSRRPAWTGLAVAGLAAAFLAGIGLGRGLPPGAGPAPAPPAQTISLVAAGPGTASGTAAIRPSSGGEAIELTVRDLPPPQPGHFYTCWLVAPDDTLQRQDRVSVGSFTTSARGLVTVRWETAADLARFPNLGVTLEPDAGSPLREGPKVLTAATSPVAFLGVPLQAPRGQTVTLAAQARPAAQCSIAVSYPAAPRLGPARADAAGAVRWTWRVDERAQPGTWPLQVRCGGDAAGTFVIVS
jgi:anti-sigma-K factor RskA